MLSSIPISKARNIEVVIHKRSVKVTETSILSLGSFQKGLILVDLHNQYLFKSGCSQGKSFAVV